MKGCFFTLVCFLAIGCSGKNKYAGADIIPTQKMVTVLWDIMQVDEFATFYLAKDSTKNIKLERIKLYQQVFRLHNISEKEFYASFTYYSGRPDLMKEMYDTLGARSDRERQHGFLTDSTKQR